MWKGNTKKEACSRKGQMRTGRDEDAQQQPMSVAVNRLSTMEVSNIHQIHYEVWAWTKCLHYTHNWSCKSQQTMWRGLVQLLFVQRRIYESNDSIKSVSPTSKITLKFKENRVSTHWLFTHRHLKQVSFTFSGMFHSLFLITHFLVFSELRGFFFHSLLMPLSRYTQYEPLKNLCFSFCSTLNHLRDVLFSHTLFPFSVCIRFCFEDCFGFCNFLH